MKLLQNPFVKIVGLMAIIYFALFANKQNPQSLGNRLSSERIKTNLSEMQQKGKFIATNVSAARSYVKTKEQLGDKVANQNAEQLPVAIKDIDSGTGQKQVACGSEINAFLMLSDSNNKVLKVENDLKLLIGSKQNWLIEKNIIGMKRGGVRNIIIPQGFQTENAELTKFLAENNSALTYQIILKEIAPISSEKSNLNCQ